MIDGEKLGSVGFEKLGTPYSEMDCQAFIEWCLARCGLKKDLAGSNTWFREVVKNGAIMTPEECVRQLGCVPSGAFLFILEQDGKEPEKYKQDGLGNASHIGICTGTRGEGAIHSSASRGCVAESKFKGKSINGGWNRVGLWNQVAYDYGGGVDPDPQPTPEPVMIMATVGNVPAGNRQDVNLRTKASTLSKLIDRVPCGAQVVLLELGDKWSKVKWKGYTGWMMTKYLLLDGEDERWTVIIPDVTTEEKEALLAVYPQATAEKGRG